MSNLTILDRVNNGDYEGLAPVEYAIPIEPMSRKAREIARIMEGVTKKVRANAAKAEKDFVGSLKAKEHPAAVDELAGRVMKSAKDLMNEHYNSVDGFNMGIDKASLSKIMDGDGEFKNQFQVGKSNGMTDPYVRAENSRRSFGTAYRSPIEYKGIPGPQRSIKMIKVPKALLASEKYGFNGPLSSVPPTQYGEYTIEFNPANVRDRTTLTTRDSLGNPQYPVLLSDPETWGGLMGEGMKLWGVVNDWNKIKNPYGFALGLVDKRFNSSRLATDRFNELQYHGPMGLDDVERIMVPKGSKIPDQWILQAEINNFDILDNEGRMIYECSAHRNPGRK